MLWIIGQDPVYFVQTKKDSSAIFRIEGVSVIVYAPKFLEYPQIAQIPVFKEVPESSCGVKQIRGLRSARWRRGSASRRG